MLPQINSSVLTIIAFLFFSTQGLSQSIDRYLISGAYHSESNRGEWVIGETVVGDFLGSGHQLYNGFLQTNLVDMSTSVRNHANFGIEIFPNPFSDALQIQHDLPHPLAMEIRDLSGRPLRSIKVMSAKSVIGLSGLPSGAYIIHYQASTEKQGSMLIFKIK